MTYPRIIFPRVPDSSRHLKRYFNLISSRPERDLLKEKGYHIHHILPRCLGGGDEFTNLIKLTYREHYLAHCLLYLAFNSVKKLGKTINSFKESAKNSRVYELVAHHEHSEETKKKIGNSNRGKTRKREIPMSDLERAERAKRCRERVWTEESKQKCRKNALENPTIHFAIAAANSPNRDRTGAKNPRADKEVWLNEEFLRQVWTENGKCGAKRLYTLTGIGNTWQSLKSILRKFKEEDDIV